MYLNIRRTVLLLAALALVLPQIAAADAADLIRAQRILIGVSKVPDKYDDVQRLLDSGELELRIAEPKPSPKGKFMPPFDEQGILTPWAEKALSASAGPQ